MRNFTDLSALPGHTIVIDGEAYNCPDLEVQDMQGSVRKVPADRILAVQWHGTHGHGSIEGFGAMEGFADKSQLAPFVSAWLRARSMAKAEAVDAILRKKQFQEETVTLNKNATDSLRSDIEAHPERAAVNQDLLTRILADNERAKAMIPTDAQIATAKAAAETAAREADADA